MPTKVVLSVFCFVRQYVFLSGMIRLFWIKPVDPASADCWMQIIVKNISPTF